MPTSSPWLVCSDSSYSSYQAGGSTSDPTVQSQAYTNDVESQAYAYGNGGYGGGSSGEDRVNAWESRFGWRIDLMAAAAYLGGPVSGELNQCSWKLTAALLLLILETQNDYVRFHGESMEWPACRRREGAEPMEASHGAHASLLPPRAR